MGNNALSGKNKAGITKTATPANLNAFGNKRRTPIGCRWLAALLVIAGVIAANDDLFANTAGSGPPFYADVLYFGDADGENTLTKIWVEVPYSSYVFSKAGNGYKANLEVVVTFEDAGGLQIGGNTASDTIRTDDLGAMLENEQTRLFYFKFQMTPGVYSMRITIDNEYGNDRPSAIFKLNVPAFPPAQAQISSLQLSYNGERSAPDSMPGQNGAAILPNVTHTFSSKSPYCFLYFEVYHVASLSDSFLVYCRLSRLGREIRSFTASYPKTGTRSGIDMKLDLVNLEPGEYALSTEVLDQNGKREAGAVAMLTIMPPTIIFSKMPGAVLQ